MHQRNYVLIFLILATCTQGAVAQGFFSGKMETGVQFGTSHYIGEINNSVYGNQFFSAGISTKYHFNKISEKDRTWGIRVDFNYTKIEGDDKNSSSPTNQNRGLNFTNDLLEGAVMAEFHFFNFRPYRSKTLFTPYIFVGFGGIYHDPKSTTISGNEESLIDAMIEARKVTYNQVADTIVTFKKYSKTSPVLPFGAGLKWNLSGPFSIGLEVNYRYVFSDFIDGVGNKEYLDFNKSSLTQTAWQVLAAGPTIGNDNVAYQNLVANGIKRGEKGNDFFMTTVVKVSYTFYKWRDPIWK